MRTTGVVGVGRSTLWGAGAVAVLLLSGCGAAGDVAGPLEGSGEVLATEGAPDSEDALEPAGRDPDLACTAIGFFGGIYVDLADVLGGAGGPYFAEVRAEGFRRTTSVPVEPGVDSTAYLDIDLDDDEAVVVDVTVRSGVQDAGPVVWTGSGSGTPTLHQPNGAGCGDVYTLGLAATAGGQLVLDPDVRVGGGDPDGVSGVEPALNEVSAVFKEGWTADPGDFNQAFQVPLPGLSGGAVRYLAVAEFLDASGVASYASAVVDVSADGSATATRADAPLTESVNAASFADRPAYQGPDAADVVVEAQRIADESDDIYS